jgi:hypothetical protein
MKRQNIVLMLFLAVLLVASTAESTELGNARQTVVLECATVIPNDADGEPGPMPPLDPAMQPSESAPLLQVIAVSETPDAPEIKIGASCGIAIGELMNNRFGLVSATPTATGMPGATPDIVTNVPSVQYLFVSRPGRGGREGDD